MRVARAFLLWSRRSRRPQTDQRRPSRLDGAARNGAAEPACCAGLVFAGRRRSAPRAAAGGRPGLVLVLRRLPERRPALAGESARSDVCRWRRQAVGPRCVRRLDAGIHAGRFRGRQQPGAGQRRGLRPGRQPPRPGTCPGQAGAAADGTGPSARGHGGLRPKHLHTALAGRRLVSRTGPMLRQRCRLAGRRGRARASSRTRR